MERMDGHFVLQDTHHFTPGIKEENILFISNSSLTSVLICLTCMCIVLQAFGAPA